MAKLRERVFSDTYKEEPIGFYHWMSAKNLQRYVDEFAGRHNICELDTIEQMAVAGGGLMGRFLTYRKLVRNNGLSTKGQA